MSATLVRTRQTPALTWAASTVVSQDIKATGAITRMHLRFNITPSGSLVAAGAPDGVWRVFDSLTLKGNGGVNYFSMGDQQISRMLHLANMYDKVLPGVGRHALATPNSYEYIIHFGSRPFLPCGRPNVFDMSAFVPAFDDTGIKLELGCTANDVMDAAITISAGSMTVTLFEVLGNKGDILAEMHRQGIRQPMVPSSNYYSYAHTGTFADVSKDIDVPAGSFLRRIGILVQDDTATRPLRVDDEVTEVALKLPVGNQRVFFDDFPSMVLSQAPNQSDLVINQGVTGGALVTSPGFAFVDLRQQADPDYGLDMRQLKTGDIKLGVTIGTYAAGDDSFYWFDQLRPYKI
jgi:hypothetical protein